MNLKFTIQELLFIDDRVTLGRPKNSSIETISNLLLEKASDSLRGITSTAQISVSIEFLGQIIEAISVWHSENSPSIFEASIEVTLEDILLLREIANSETMVGDAPVGLDLKKKLSYAYISLKKGFPDKSQVLEDFITSDKEDVNFDTSKFEDWKNKPKKSRKK